jgi:hypothetical protein
MPKLNPAIIALAAVALTALNVGLQRQHPVENALALNVPKFLKERSLSDLALRPRHNLYGDHVPLHLCEEVKNLVIPLLKNSNRPSKSLGNKPRQLKRVPQ